MAAKKLRIKVYAFIRKKARKGESPKDTIQGDDEEIDKETIDDAVKWKKEKQRMIDEFFDKLRGKPSKLKKHIKIKIPRHSKTESWKDGTTRKVIRDKLGRFLQHRKVKNK